MAEEKPLYIFINKTQYATIFCTPKDFKELAVGHLLSEGIIKSVNELEAVAVKEDVCQIKLKPTLNLASRLKIARQSSRIILSACGGPYRSEALKRLRKIESTFKVEAETVQSCVNSLNRMAKTFRKTGGVHVAAVYKAEGALVAFAEDVGRHNAVDKAIGKCALKKTDFSQCFLALSGRLKGDIVLKAAKVGIPAVASIAAALDSGIEIARKANLTLIGFVRGKRMNIYNAPERIIP